MSTRVMIVDDAAFMRQMIRSIVTGMGCDVVAEACDGNDACERYRHARPDLVTMDLVMPNKGGLEAMKDIRAFDPQAKFVVISAMDQRQTMMEALKLGAAEYVVKPFERQRVQEAIARVLAE